MVKGSHIVVSRLYEGDHAYILQNPDRRVVFAIPYEGRFTLIGTTDVPWTAGPQAVEIGQSEIEYLCESVNRWFASQISLANVAWSYAGVRPLHDEAAADTSAVTRDYVLDLEAPTGCPPVLSVFGGKITTYRRLAEHVMEKLGPYLPPHRAGWTAGCPLPGGDLPGSDFDRFLTEFRRRHRFLPDTLARRLARAYGTRAEKLLDGAQSLDALGEDLGGGLTQAELGSSLARSGHGRPTTCSGAGSGLASRARCPRKPSAGHRPRPRIACWRQEPGSPAASAGIQPVLRRSGPSRPSRNIPAEAATRACVNNGRSRPFLAQFRRPQLQRRLDQCDRPSNIASNHQEIGDLLQTAIVVVGQIAERLGRAYRARKLVEPKAGALRIPAPPIWAIRDHSTMDKPLHCQASIRREIFEHDVWPDCARHVTAL